MTKPILLVEDSDDDLTFALRALRRVGLHESTAVVRNGKDALDYLSCRGVFSDRTPVNPSIVLLDLKLPFVDGLEVLRHIRGAFSLKHLPVAVMSSSCLEADVLHAYDQGANCFIVKPVDFGEYTQTISQTAAFWIKRNRPPPAFSQAQIL
ncbi:MAG TPA: response regulator [Opitutaceae bacterium]|nr:response regulator [Opitutaceae bacterium]